MKPWKTLSRRKVLESGRFLTVEMHAVKLPDGRVIEDWSWLITPDYAVVLAETTQGKFLTFYQTKYALAAPALSLVGGFLEPGEQPEAAARRELLEETGYTAAEWFSLGGFVVDANHGAGTANLFLARQAQRTASPTAGDLEEQELRFLSRSELEQVLDAGEFKVLASAATVALGLRQLFNIKARA